jgi:PhnB protein
MNNSKLLPYLIFSGNCREALEYYKKIFDGEIKSMVTFENSPIPVSKDLQKRIFDSEFNADGIRFKASDDLPEHPIKVGTNISLFVSFTDKSEKESVFKILSERGKVLFPLEDNFGMLQDKYKIQWMFVSDT